MTFSGIYNFPKVMYFFNLHCSYRNPHTTNMLIFTFFGKDKKYNAKISKEIHSMRKLFENRRNIESKHLLELI